MRRIPLRMRALWWIMVRSERLAQWCRAQWLKWHETGGVMVPDETPTPTEKGRP